MTKEELMKPRYEVIADYPGNDLIIGVVFEPNSDWGEPYLNKYPHLFRKLHWWEHRKPEEMPSYLIRKRPPHQVYKIGELRLDMGCFMIDGYNFPESLSLYEPATETEYANYITQTK